MHHTEKDRNPSFRVDWIDFRQSIIDEPMRMPLQKKLATLHLNYEFTKFLRLAFIESLLVLRAHLS